MPLVILNNILRDNFVTKKIEKHRRMDEVTAPLDEVHFTFLSAKEVLNVLGTKVPDSSEVLRSQGVNGG